MKKIILALSFLAMMLGMTACKNSESVNAMLNPEKQEREFLRDAIRHHSPDVQRVDLIGNTVVYTHIFDGIIDVKTYTYDGDVCVEAERVYTFPSQMSALRHYRRAVEQADLYDNIELFNNEVKYDLKEAQHKLETKGLTKEQLKEKFDKQIADAKADLHKAGDKIKKAGCCIERDMPSCAKGKCDNKGKPAGK
jgi:hypothetical protein